MSVRGQHDSAGGIRDKNVGRAVKSACGCGHFDMTFLFSQPSVISAATAGSTCHLC